MFKCKRCQYESSDAEDFIGLDCNEDAVSLDEYDLEANAQNPDYLTRLYCNECYFDLYVEGADPEEEGQDEYIEEVMQ